MNPETRLLTPVKAVPASAQAKGSMYQGALEMSHSAPAMDASVVNTAPHARSGLIWYTCNRHSQAKLCNSVQASSNLPGSCLSCCGYEVPHHVHRQRIGGAAQLFVSAVTHCCDDSHSHP